MTTHEEVFAKMRASIEDYDKEAAVAAANEALEAGVTAFLGRERCERGTSPADPRP